jgi:hypothetical protein
VISTDWQTIVAVGCIGVAALWWLRRALQWSRARSSCETGCGRCSTDGVHQLDVSVTAQTKKHPHA